MSFNDQEIVALSGGHTLGSCHRVRSGYDGPWTSRPLRFDNEYFVNLLTKKWTEKKWNGPRQFEDESGKLMMLPTDIALIEDSSFKRYVELYAKDEKLFFRDFASAYGKLVALGCPEQCQPGFMPSRATTKEEASAQFRDLAMHGSVLPLKQIRDKADVHSREATSGRTALHKGAFWGHVEMVQYLVRDCKLNVDVQDYNGDTPLHDAARFGHVEVAKILIDAGTNTKVKNKSGLDAAAIAKDHGYDTIVTLITDSKKNKSDRPLPSKL